MDELDSIFSDDWGAEHRSGLAAVIGRPNVGKSTLINGILSQKIAITAAKPQTTRQRQLGIYTTAEAQILFVDTPGIHQPHTKLGDFMLGVARGALQDADVSLWMVDASRPPNDEDRQTADLLGRSGSPTILLLNKVDLVPGAVDPLPYTALLDADRVFQICALSGQGIPALLAELPALMPLGPRYYPADQASEANLRFLAAEIIREKIIDATSEEIPYAVALEIISFREGRERTRIEAVIHVERDSQKGIIIGKGGRMIKRIGVAARADLERQLGTRVRLETRVKVRRNWRGDEAFMRRVGYALPKRDRDQGR